MLCILRKKSIDPMVKRHAIVIPENRLSDIKVNNKDSDRANIDTAI